MCVLLPICGIAALRHLWAWQRVHDILSARLPIKVMAAKLPRAIQFPLHIIVRITRPQLKPEVKIKLSLAKFKKTK